MVVLNLAAYEGAFVPVSIFSVGYPQRLFMQKMKKKLKEEELNVCVQLFSFL